MDMTIVEVILFALMLFSGFCMGVWLGLTLGARNPAPDTPEQPKSDATAVDAAEEARQLEERERQWQNMMTYSGERQTGE